MGIWPNPKSPISIYQIINKVYLIVFYYFLDKYLFIFEQKKCFYTKKTKLYLSVQYS